MDAQSTILITGGTGGLGRRTAKALADSDRLIVITGRDPARVAAAAQEIGRRSAGEVVGLPLELGSLDQVRDFAARFAGHRFPPLRGLVCNAGIQVVTGTPRSADGFELTFAVNHLAHFLLVQELLPHLRPPGRIIVVASDTHDPARSTGMPAPAYTTAQQLARPEAVADSPKQGRRRYTTSKLCNVLMAYELARRLQDTGITVNSFDPGLMPGTGLARDYGVLQALAWRYLLPALTVIPGLNIHTPSQSARALARLLADPELASTTGAYFSGTRRTRSSTESYDPIKATDLWQTSERLTR